jgi:hypothetical protein
MRSTAQVLKEADVSPAEAHVGLVLLLASFAICGAICSTMISLAVLS